MVHSLADLLGRPLTVILSDPPGVPSPEFPTAPRARLPETVYSFLVMSRLYRWNDLTNVYRRAGSEELVVRSSGGHGRLDVGQDHDVLVVGSTKYNAAARWLQSREDYEDCRFRFELCQDGCPGLKPGNIHIRCGDECLHRSEYNAEWDTWTGHSDYLDRAIIRLQHREGNSLKRIVAVGGVGVIGTIAGLFALHDRHFLRDIRTRLNLTWREELPDFECVFAVQTKIDVNVHDPIIKGLTTTERQDQIRVFPRALKSGSRRTTGSRPSAATLRRVSSKKREADRLLADLEGLASKAGDVVTVEQCRKARRQLK